MDSKGTRPDVSDDADVRASRRYRQAAWTSVTSLAARSIGLLTSLVSVRLLLNYLGEERFGVWATLTSMLAFLSFADLGLGNGLMNSLAKANARDDRRQAQRDVSTALLLLGIIAAVFGVGFALTYTGVPWSDTFNVDAAEARVEVPLAVLGFGAVFLLSVPLAVGQKIELAYQTGSRYNVSLGLANLVAFGGVLLGIRAGVGLPLLVLAGVAPLALAGAMTSLQNFFWTRPWLRPNLTQVNAASLGVIARSGMLFLALQVSVSLAYSIDNLVITRVLGAASVPGYAIPFKLFNTAHFFIAVLMAPLWPAYREAFVRHDHTWIRRTLKRSIYISLLVSASFAVVLAVWGEQILQLWLGRDLEPSPSLLIGLALWTVLAGAGNAVAMFLNGTGILRVQVVLSVLMTVANLGLSIFLCARIGIEGAIWSTVVSYTLFIVLPLMFYLPKVLGRLGVNEQPN